MPTRPTAAPWIWQWLRSRTPPPGYPRGYVAYIAARLGDRKRAEDEIAQALQLSPRGAKVIRSAVLTYEALGQPDRAIQVLDAATPDLLRELDRQPDLADFSRDSRFRQLVARNPNGGKLEMSTIANAVKADLEIIANLVRDNNGQQH